MNISKQFWKGAGERAAKTFLQVGVATLGITAGAQYTGAEFLALPWETALVTASVATILSVVTSLLNINFTTGSTGVEIDTTVSDFADVDIDESNGAVVPESVFDDAPTVDPSVAEDDEPVVEPRRAE